MKFSFTNAKTGQREGPVDGPTLRQRVASGCIRPETIIETDDGRQLPASKITGLEPFFRRSPVPITEPAPTQTPTQQEQSYDPPKQPTARTAEPIINNQETSTASVRESDNLARKINRGNPALAYIASIMFGTMITIFLLKITNMDAIFIVTFSYSLATVLFTTVFLYWLWNCGKALAETLLLLRQIKDKQDRKDNPFR